MSSIKHDKGDNTQIRELAHIQTPERLRVIRKCTKCRKSFMSVPWQTECWNCVPRDGGKETQGQRDKRYTKMREKKR